MTTVGKLLSKNHRRNQGKPDKRTVSEKMREVTDEFMATTVCPITKGKCEGSSCKEGCFVGAYASRDTTGKGGYNAYPPSCGINKLDYRE